jgi:hypothetical protein
VISLEAVDECNLNAMSPFLSHGGGALPYAGVTVADLALWHAANRAGAERAHRDGSRFARLLHSAMPGGKQRWRGPYATQVPPPPPPPPLLSLEPNPLACLDCA